MTRYIIKINIYGSMHDVYDTERGVFVTRWSTLKNAKITAKRLNGKG